MSLLFLTFFAIKIEAIPLDSYRKNIEQTIGGLDTINLQDESETPEAHQQRFTATLNSVRALLPLKQSVEWEDTVYQVDNTWLHQLLAELEQAPYAQRAKLLARVQERLHALYERLVKTETARIVDKTQAKQKLEEILARPEFGKRVTEESALARLWTRFVQWLSSLIPQPRPPQVEPGSAQRITTVSQIFVVLLSVAVLAIVVRAFLARLGKTRSTTKRQKLRPRVVLGERLEPEQSANDLLSEAEGLARSGEIRAAIRKGYIALLVELGDRKILSLAQHKTNRDYLRALSQRERLYERMMGLTDSFERHWYGLAHATESDWVEFRSRYREALQE